MQILNGVSHPPWHFLRNRHVVITSAAVRFNCDNSSPPLPHLFRYYYAFYYITVITTLWILIPSLTPFVYNRPPWSWWRRQRWRRQRWRRTLAGWKPFSTDDFFDGGYIPENESWKTAKTTTTDVGTVNAYSRRRRLVVHNISSGRYTGARRQTVVKS